MEFNLPPHYTPQRIIGVTKATPRWTVYFDDGSRYTQAHRDDNNLGFHPPMPTFFFGNIPKRAVEMHSARLKASGLAYYEVDDEMLEFYKEYGRVNWQRNRTVRFQAPPTGIDARKYILLEVKGAGRNLGAHPSRSALEYVSLSDKYDLTSRIRSRYEDTIQVNTPGLVGNWVFSDAPYRERPETGREEPLTWPLNR
ncbi:hypothetical protein FMN50_19135 [Rhodobacterales bacterium]|nr:hypothetical protein FMN50_19135 [Rhodobacterales bacterium]